jgi:hypothetical protein
MASEARQQERRGDAYIEILTALQRLLTGVERTAPIFSEGPPPEPPEPLAEPDLWRLNALVLAVAQP